MELVDLFLAPEDLFRLGNATSPRLTHIRTPKDINTINMNGITVVVANGKGISLATKDRLNKSPVDGWVWKIAKGTQIPRGLKLLNDRPGHYSICPQSNMPLDEFVGLLSKLAMKCQKTFKKQII